MVNPSIVSINYQMKKMLKYPATTVKLFMYLVLLILHNIFCDLLTGVHIFTIVFL